MRVHKIKSALYELLPYVAFSKCAKNYLFANLLSFYRFSQKLKVLFLCGVVKLKVIVTSCCHRFICIRFLEFVVFL